MSKTTIAWTDESLNPLVGCTKVSARCSRCYAETAAASPRLQQFDQYKTVVDEHGHWNGHVEFVPRMLDKLFTYKKPRKIFMPSMSDPFHPAVKDEWLDQMMAAIALNQHLTFQLLTKRPERMLEYFNTPSVERRVFKKGCAAADDYPSKKKVPHCWPLQNLQLGVTVENQAAADDRS